MNRYNRFTVFRHILRLFKEEHVIISKVQVTCIIILMTFSTAFSAISPYLYSTLVDDVMM